MQTKTLKFQPPHTALPIPSRKMRKSSDGYQSTQRKTHEIRSPFNIQSSKLKPLIQVESVNKQNEEKWMKCFKPLRSDSLESRSIELKISKNILQENQKIKMFREKLMKFAKNPDSQKQNHCEKEKCFYKSAQSSPYVRKQKQRRRAIKQFTKSISELEGVYKQKTQKDQQILDDFNNFSNQRKLTKQNVRKRVYVNMDNFVLYGEQPKWKQFQSWRRLRYKITIKGYTNKKQKQNPNKNKNGCR